MLWDVLIALGLLAVFLTVTTKILQATMRIPHRANELETLATRFDGVVEQLRRDAWNSTAVSAVDQDGKSVRIERAGDGEPSVTWAIDDAGTVSRTEKDTQTWPGVAKGMTFQIDGPVLILVEPPDDRGEGRRIPLASAVSLARQGRPS
jgi:type II secretory pathway component PulJ